MARIDYVIFRDGTSEFVQLKRGFTRKAGYSVVYRCEATCAEEACRISRKKYPKALAKEVPYRNLKLQDLEAIISWANGYGKK